MSTASEDIGQSLGQLLALVFQTILPKGRNAAEGIIFLLVLAVAMAAFTMGHTTRFKWWNVVALFWWFGANSQLWAAVASVAAIVGCVLLAWVDFVHLNPRGAWPFFYMFSGACWLTVLIWLWNVWPEEDSFGMHFTFAFLLYAATSSIYVTLTLFLKKAMLGGGGLKQVAAQRAHGDARPASEAEVTAALSGTKRKPPQPRKFDQ